MSGWIHEKYALLLSNNLEKFVRKSANLFNFRCPFCGDSKNNKHKARGYLIREASGFFYYCQNCGAKGLNRFDDFLKAIDPALFYQMKKDLMAENGKTDERTYQPKTESIDHKSALDDLEPISNLPPKHPARLYIKRRLIPKDVLFDLYYCENFGRFVNSVQPDKLSVSRHAKPRIIIPFFDRNGLLYGFQGRSLDPLDTMRYISIILDDTKPKAFGLNKINFNKRYYVFEGPFDAMFIKNSMAACGSDVLAVLNSVGCSRDQGVIVFDNEPRNTNICSNIAKAIRMNWNVCVWPDYWEYKDVNDAILDGKTISEVNHIIDQSTYSGLTAQCQLSAWRKINENEKSHDRS